MMGYGEVVGRDRKRQKWEAIFEEKLSETLLRRSETEPAFDEQGSNI